MKSSSSPAAAALIPRISVTMVSLHTTADGNGANDHHDHISQSSSLLPPLKPSALTIDTAHAQNTNTVWYDDDSESSSSSSEGEDDEEEPYRPMHLAPPPSSPVHIPIQQPRSSRQQQQQQSPKPTLLNTNVNSGVGAGGPPRSPCSPLRNSFTPIIVEIEAEQQPRESSSSLSSAVLPDDKKGLDRARVEDLVNLRRSSERRAHMNMRIQTTGLSLPQQQEERERVTSPVHTTTPSSARRPMDLRKEITLKAHAAKHAEERRQSFLARLRASPSSSPTTLTTPVTPPDSPAEFHYTLPSPGLVSPLALFEAYSLQQNQIRQMQSLGQQSQAIDGAREEEREEKKQSETMTAASAYERVERVNWAQQAARSGPAGSENDDDDDLRSPPARISNVFSRGINGVTAERKKAQSASADFNRLPIGVGRLQIPARTGLHALKPHHQGMPITVPSNNVTIPDAVGSSKILSGLDLKTTSVVVPPRRGASLLHSNGASAGKQQMMPAAAARQRSHQLPSLLEISERLASGKNATSTKAKAGVSARPRTPLLLPIPGSVHTGTGENGRTANATANVRAAAFPGFLRERTRLQQQQQQQQQQQPASVPAPAHSTLTVHQHPRSRPRSEMRIIISDADTPEIPAVVVSTPSSVASPTSPVASFAISIGGSNTVPAENVDAVLVVPPARPKSVDAALQERKQRGNAMMARLSMSSTHRRRKSESSVPLLMQQVQPLSMKTGTVELKSNNHHAAAAARRPDAGWF